MYFVLEHLLAPSGTPRRSIEKKKAWEEKSSVHSFNFEENKRLIRAFTKLFLLAQIVYVHPNHALQFDKKNALVEVRTVLYHSKMITRQLLTHSMRFYSGIVQKVVDFPWEGGEEDRKFG